MTTASRIKPPWEPAPVRPQPAPPAVRETTLVLGPVDTAPSTARATLKAALAVWGLAYLTDTAELITSDSLN